MSAVNDFVRTYAPQAEAQIAFSWNGKHASEFVDWNMQFRQEVCAYFEDENDVFPLPLVAALFKAETLFAKEAWGVNRVVSKLAQELLERGGVEYLDVYLAGARTRRQMPGQRKYRGRQWDAVGDACRALLMPSDEVSSEGRDRSSADIAKIGLSEAGWRLARVNTEKPWSIESVGRITMFTVLRSRFLPAKLGRQMASSSRWLK
eukprot:gene35478-43742_t